MTEVGGARGATAAERNAERKAEAKDTRRRELLDAAAEVVRRDGPFVSMEQIAVECGITKPIIYRHFVDRDGLLGAMAERFVEELITAVTPFMYQDAHPIDLLTATVDAYLALIDREHNLYRFLRNAGTDRPEVMAGLFAEEVALIIKRMLIERGLPTTPARPWAYGLVGMVHMTGDWWVTNRATSTDAAMPRADVVEHLASLLWQGVDRLGLGTGDAEPPDPRTRPRSPSMPKTSTTRTRTTKSTTSTRTTSTRTTSTRKHRTTP